MSQFERLESRRLLQAAGNIDPLFANGTTPRLISSDAVAYAVAALPDGGFVTAGKCEGPSGHNHGVALARYSADGTLQATFGRGGQLFVPFDGYDKPVVIAVQPDGKIVLAGSATETSEIIRVTADGKFDTSFGDGGIANVDLGNGFDQPLTVRVGPGGQILMLGRFTGANFDGGGTAFVQLAATGTLNTDFGTGGKAALPQATFDDTEILPDGQIEAVGANAHGAVIARLTSNGRPDLSFGNAGNGIDTFAYAGFFTRLRALRDGSALAATFQQNYVTLQHRFADGHYEVFGSLYFPGPVSDVADIVIQHGGKIVVCASVDVSDAATGKVQRRVALARFELNGFPDESFGDNGIKIATLLPPVDGTGSPAITLLAKGRLVVTTPGDYTLAPRNFISIGLTRNGQTDPTMGENGRVTTDILSPVDSSFQSLAPLPDGRLLALSSVIDGSGGPLQIVRLTSNGRVDPSFHGGLPLSVNFGTLGEPYNDGKIVVSPTGDKFAILTTLSNPDPTFYWGGAVAMFNADGSPDQHFGQNGIAALPGGPMFPTELNVGLFQGDRLLVAGKGEGGMLIARLTSRGVLDTSFGDGGKAVSLFNPEPMGDYPRTTQAVALALDPQNRIVVVGNDQLEFDLGMTSALAITRYTPDGKPDRGFGRDGKVGGLDVPTAWLGIASGVRIQNDGGILVSGSTLTDFPRTLDSTMNVLRFNPDGTPDPSFGNAGVAAVNVGPYIDDAAALFIQPDDRIILVGTTSYDGPYSDTPQDITLARFEPNGRLDASFGNAGLSTSSFGNEDRVTAAILSDNGQLTIAGDSDQQPLLARFLLTDSDAATASILNGTLTITGTPGPDTIRLRPVNGRLRITSVFQNFPLTTFSKIQIDALAGGDTIDASASPVPVIINGGDGNDVIYGGPKADLLSGNAGNDTLFGGAGNDTLHGNDGLDYLNGGLGADQLFGDAGNDQLLAANDQAIDRIDGGASFDRAKGDDNDLFLSNEGLLS